MPLYDYRCSDCGREIEVTHGIHDAGPTTCEACGGVMRKALSTPAIHFKGSGWAKKDARAAAKPSAATSAAGGVDAKPGGQGGVDAKPGGQGGAAGSGSSQGDGGDAAGTPSGGGSKPSGAAGDSAPKTTAATGTD